LKESALRAGKFFSSCNIPGKPAVLGRLAANVSKSAGFVQRQGLMNNPSGINVGGHWPRIGHAEHVFSVSNASETSRAGENSALQ